MPNTIYLLLTVIAVLMFLVIFIRRTNRRIHDAIIDTRIRCANICFERSNELELRAYKIVARQCGQLILGNDISDPTPEWPQWESVGDPTPREHHYSKVDTRTLADVCEEEELNVTTFGPRTIN